MDKANYHGPRPVARSPIDPVGGPTDVASEKRPCTVSLVDVSATAKLVIRAGQAGPMAKSLGVEVGQSVRDSGRLTVAFGPGEWLVIAPATETSSTAADLRHRSLADSQHVSVVDVTHGRAAMRLTGERARDVLAKVCAVDIADAQVPDRAAFRSWIARVVTDVVRDDRGTAGDLPSYLLLCERSSANYLWNVLLDAGEEYGVESVSAVRT